ncbi:MAG: hypothetical protein ABIJ09_14170 [Pseudomonadota bacterium]
MTSHMNLSLVRPLESSSRNILLLAASIAGVVLTACPDPGPPPLDLPEGCQPLLAGADCMLPYPSDFFLVEDGTRPSGHRVQMGRAAALLTKDGYSADVTDWRAADGYSSVPPIVAILGSALSEQGLVGFLDDYDRSVADDSPTLIIEAHTGRRIPHFVDLDPRATDPLRQALILRPMIALDWRTRYVVALRHLQRPDGSEAPAPEGFRRIRDGQVGEDSLLNSERSRFGRDVFPVLKQAGVDQTSLQLAWDFTTGSVEDRTADMLRARQLALAYLDQHPPTVSDVAVIENENPQVWRRIIGKLDGPMFMVIDGPGKDLARDAAGQVQLNGTVSIPFTIIVPASVRDRFEPGVTLEFGHGFFGSQDELENGNTQTVMQAVGAVTFGVNWWGMSSVDVGVVVAAMGEEMWRTMQFSERVVQGMVNHLTLSAAMRGVLQDLPELHRPLDAGQPGVHADPRQPRSSNAGALVYEPRNLNFLGISQGHILGGMYLALNPRQHRGVLNVGGCAFTHMMFRAQPFEGFLWVMDIAMPDPLEQQKYTASLQMHFDRIDPALWAPYVLRDTLPDGSDGGARQRQVLLQNGVGDASVPPFSAFLHARLLGIPVLEPSARHPWGLPVASAPHQGSAITVFDMGYDDSWAAIASPWDGENPVHNTLREQSAVTSQMRAFFETGIVEDTCQGDCTIE